ncbi:MAG: hypothetical protein WB800_18850 [Streptosporangiaceae bacterium]
MNVPADQVRAATRGAAAVITKDTVPPLRLDESPGGRRHRPGHRTRPAWVAPLAAAAAIIIVAGGAVTARSLLVKSAAPRPSAPAAPTRGASAGSYAGVPPYYVAVANSSLTVVRGTWTGATLARITTRTPVVGVAGAADGRTFVLDEQRSVSSSGSWVGQPTFYLLRLTASGAEESLIRLAVPAIPSGTVVSGLALSPDGSKLAVDVDSGGFPTARFMEIMTYTLATGAFRSWTTSGVTNADASYGFTGSGVDGAQSISWTADSRTLAFSVENQAGVGVRLLDTAAGGTDLMADSRLAVTVRNFGDLVGSLRNAAPPYYFVSCTTDAMISVDGSAIVCGYSTSIRKTTTMGFARYSTRTGKMNHVAGLVHFRGKAPLGISLYWVNSTGKIAIGTSETSGGGRVGVMNGNTFTPLPGVTGFEAIAW